MSETLEIPNFIGGGTSLVTVLESVNFGSGRRTPGHHSPNITDLTMTRVIDQYSPLFFQEISILKSRSMTIYFRKGTATTIKIYMTAEIENAQITSYSYNRGDKPGDKPIELISINFTKISYKFDG